MRKTSRKLKHLIREEEKTVAKIAELKEYLAEVRELRKQEEDAEILKSIRSLKLGARDLYGLLSGIRDGTVTMETREILPEEAGEDGDGGGSPGEAAPDPVSEKEADEQ